MICIMMHSRDLGWTADGNHFVSASRDKTVKVWALAPSPAGSDEDAVAWTTACTTKKLEDSVTSLDVAPA